MVTQDTMVLKTTGHLKAIILYMIVLVHSLNNIFFKAEFVDVNNYGSNNHLSIPTLISQSLIVTMPLLWTWLVTPKTTLCHVNYTICHCQHVPGVTIMEFTLIPSVHLWAIIMSRVI